VGRNDCDYTLINIAVTPSAMQLKTARLTILITPSTKQAFEEQCRSHDATPSQVVRRLIRDYMEQQPAREAAVRKPAPARRAR
jgi:hypothetical protein